ncbi:hypothetical protein EV284_2560 [Streptomyces sp. BK022]|nr:hypothetical protein EV284_2560 [Streptomyces sp. BK022]
MCGGSRAPAALTEHVSLATLWATRTAQTASYHAHGANFSAQSEKITEDQAELLALLLHEGRLKEVPLPCTVRQANDMVPLGSILTRTDREGCATV